MWYVEVFINDLWLRCPRQFKTSNEAFAFAQERFFDYKTRLWAPARELTS